MKTALRPSSEHLRATVVRNVLIAIVATAVIALSTSRSPHPIGWPIAFALMLFPTFGGHYLDVLFLAWVRPRLPSSPSVQRAARVTTWFIGGCALGTAMVLAGHALGAGATRWPARWMLGAAFVAIELVVHASLQARGVPNFYDGRG